MGSAKNYTEQGAERTVIGGELVIRNGGKLLFNTQEFKPAAFQEASKAIKIEGLKTDLNSLLEKLKQAGLMEQK